MNKRRNKPELLAPAGSYESLIAAIQAGADSVYFGVEQLNMRARSGSFVLDDLPLIVDTCNKYDVKSYLTLNTVLYDHDLNMMKVIVDKVKEYDIDAVIASDHAVMNYAEKKGVKVHISTQANVSNIETVEFYSRFADAVVLARELSLKQVKDIVRNIEKRNIKGPSGELIKVEVFAHGALCMAISGKCHLSLHSHYASANRGACLQNCRRKYTVVDQEEGYEFEIDNEYIMSAKDLCTIDFLDQLITTGAGIFKIEGRSRAPEYVYTVTQCYREAINACLDSTYSDDRIKTWKEKLATVYNRDFWEGYYLGKKMGEWSDTSGSKASKKKVYIGKGLKYFKKVQVAEFVVDAFSLNVGDEILITGPSTGVIKTKINELRVDDRVVKNVQKGQYFSMPLNSVIRSSDKLYKLVDA